MLACPPGILLSDSVQCIHSALLFKPNMVRPIGYSFFLVPVKPYHSFYLVAAVQHVMGLTTGAEVYALLRHLKLPAWGLTGRRGDRVPGGDSRL
jgi:hypothetical protein